jgi:hypothetical protein
VEVFSRARHAGKWAPVTFLSLMRKELWCFCHETRQQQERANCRKLQGSDSADSDDESPETETTTGSLHTRSAFSLETVSSSPVARKQVMSDAKANKISQSFVVHKCKCAKKFQARISFVDGRAHKQGCDCDRSCQIRTTIHQHSSS